EEGGNISLAGRDYMQKLFATKKYQVTDSFAAGADGKTLNYTIGPYYWCHAPCKKCIIILTINIFIYYFILTLT
ncbi:hypothetical protein ACTPD5_20995, partial [Clostridioides difficile]|uniref:hypothetical protein n=1 Tax=Clostridioides difficile TaxID=1496 RepID=UPI003F8D69A0